jgi:hypothetical protein
MRVINSFCIIFTDIGADVLDLAETMVASDGLNYEPVSRLLYRLYQNQLYKQATIHCTLFYIQTR